MPAAADIPLSTKQADKCFPEIETLDQGKPLPSSNSFTALCKYIDARLDCADFRMISILRTLCAYGDLLSQADRAQATQSVLGFKYWMDEPGEDSMCYWSENHQLLFAAAEYIAGQLFPGERFSNNGMTGTERMAHARPRIETWLHHRFAYGFIEWHSNVYYEEDIAPLCLLVDFAEDTGIAGGARMALDLLLLDMAMHSWRGVFPATSGRCYEDQKRFPSTQDTIEVSDWLCGTELVAERDWRRLSAHFFLCRKYQTPEVIRKIAQDQRPVEILTSMGLDLNEVRRELPENDIDSTGLFLWAMEAFTNPQSIRLALRMFREWRLEQNVFLKDLKVLTHPLLRALNVYPLISRLLNPSTNGVAIQRANTYTFRTEHYLLSTAQRYHAGEFGDQHHIWQATLSPRATIFTTHPAVPMFDDNARNFSPSYWVGNGIQPDCAQSRNVVLCIYRLGGRRGYLERERQRFTHAWFPQERFDEVEVDAFLAVGRAGKSYVALFSALPMEADEERTELIQRGKNTAWVCVVGSETEYEMFADFRETMRGATLNFTGKRLRFLLPHPGNRAAAGDTAAGRGSTAPGSAPPGGGTPAPPHELSLTYTGAFTVDGARVETDYPRLQSPYGSAPRKPSSLVINLGDYYLRHDYESGHRTTEEEHRHE